ALEALDGHARAGLLTLDAASARLAEARADAAADALARMHRAFLVPEFVEFHRSCSSLPQASSTTRTRCWTLAIIPRTEGVSSKVARRCSLLSPRPISVAR